MGSPADCRFTESHEWFRVDGDTVTIGITQFAADELTDVTYVELKDSGTTVAAGETVGEVESVKTTSDVLSVVGGEIAEINQAVIDDPSLVNSDPFGAGWLVRLSCTDIAPLDALLDQAAYDSSYPLDA